MNWTNVAEGLNCKGEEDAGVSGEYGGEGIWERGRALEGMEEENHR